MSRFFITILMLLAVAGAASGCGIKGKLDLPDQAEGEIFNK